jgi:hypothetical protein
VPALGLDVDVENGGFTVSRLPPGTWTIVVKAIGYEPQSAMVDLVANATVSTVVVIGEKVQMLGAISVLGTPSAEYRKLAEILERKSVGFGTFFMPGDERITRALGLTDLVRTAAGFDIHGMGRVIGGSKGLNRCRPTLFVDGMRDAPMVPMREVLAVAAYPDVAGTPVNWRDGRMCAAIAVWTKR